MGRFYSAPLVLGAKPNDQVDPDLALALVFWFLEAEREKGSGLIRKKKTERITHVALLYRPILIKDYARAAQAFDCCGISESHIRYGIVPSLTCVPFYLVSDNNWAHRPESYAEGLNIHSEEFEKAREKYQYLIKGWITDSAILGELSLLLRFSIESDPISYALPQFIDSSKAGIALSELDKIKIVVCGEIAHLTSLKQKVNEKTAEVLKPLEEEFARIEDNYNKEVDKIRPSVLENKEQIEGNRIRQHQAIQARFSGRLHDLQNKLDAANAKIDAYDPYGGREPRGGINKQYSIRDSARKRIKELRHQQEDEIAIVNERYDSMTHEQERRITAIEERKQHALQQPSRKINTVRNSTTRFIRSVDDLIKNHESVRATGSLGLTIPSQITESEFVLYLPLIVATFDDGTKPRTQSFSCCTLKDGKGHLGGLKGLVGMKFMPLEMPSEPLAKFMAGLTVHPFLQSVLSIFIQRYDLLYNSLVKGQVFSGIDKMQKRGWVKQKEATEFREAVDELFSTVDSEDAIPEKVDSIVPSAADFEPMPIQQVRFVNYEGIETQVEIDKLDSMRNNDVEQFNRKASSLIESNSKSRSILVFLEGLTFPYSKEHCIGQEENWVQQMLHMQLANSQFKKDVLRERPFRVGETGAIGSRIDFDVGGVGIEVKIFRSTQDFQRLTSEMLRYKEKYQEIIIPYINAGALSNERLVEELNLLQKHYPQIKGYISLKCKE